MRLTWLCAVGEAAEGSAGGRGCAVAAGKHASTGGVPDCSCPAAQVHRVVLQHHRQTIAKVEGCPG